jgi:hypothetical protein
MASIIRVKRSTGTLAPSTLNYGEVAYTTGVGTHGNRGQRLFIGDNSSNPQLIGGQYYADLLSNPPGKVDSQDNPTTPNNGFVAILDTKISGYVGDGNLVARLPRVDQWTVDDITIDGNSIYSNVVDQHITFRPNGTGRVQFLDDDEVQYGTSDDIRSSYDTAKDALFFERGSAGNTADIRIADDIHFQFGTDNDSRIYYDEASSDRLVIEGASWTYANTVQQVAIATNTTASSTTTGALIVGGGVGIASDLHVGGTLNVTGAAAFTSGNVTITNDLTVYGNTNLGDSISDTITIAGIVTHVGTFINVGGATIDGIGISSNTISTKSGGGNTLYIDPYPDGLSNEGLVVIKGDLQVDGTTTTVNSNTVSVNDPILELGEVTSVRTVMATVGTGTTDITLDSVVGINTGDIIDNAGVSGLPASSGDRTILYYNTGTKVVSIAGQTTGQIGVSTQLTITHAYDTNTDRGISFNYNTSSGTGNNKIGFFGYHDGTNTGSQAPERAWTYIPDATISNSVVTGVRGYLDIKGIYYQTGDFSTHGIVYFDSTGLQNSTTAPNAATFTSTQLLTAVTEIDIIIPSAYTVTAGQQVTQVNNSSAYGMVKTSSSGTTITLIGVQGTFDTSNDLKVEGTNISLTPSSVTTIYTSKPTWTTTIDGGTF